MYYKSMKYFMYVLLFAFLFFPSAVLAHRSGCHTLHTCPSDSGSYVCGDLGYACDGTTSVNDVDINTVNVPLLVETVFGEVFGRKPNGEESNYWKARFRSDKESIYQIRRAVAWHKANGSTGPTGPQEVEQPKSVVPTGSDLIPHINRYFRSVYGRNPTVSENAYWVSRVLDKPYEPAMIGAMTFHRNHNINH